jgi:pimeloyl-ACP methyl ester carboxylesterase
MLRKFVVLLACLLLVSVSSVSAQDGLTFVLVHGAFQDASGWDGVIAALEAEGHTAVAVNLAGRGDDTTPAAQITLATYRDAVIEVVEAQDGPVILVGHSFGGMTISNVAEAIPDRVSALVYVAAYLPRDGESLLAIAANDRYAASAEEGALIIDAEQATIAVPAEAFAPVFCPDCSAEQMEMVSASQVTEPLIPLNEPLILTEENFGSVRKIYVLTAQDLAVSPQLQVYMLANTPVDRVYALDTGHVPYITAPEALAALLIAGAQE